MKTVIIDTNALISFVTDRNPAQQEKIAGIFEAAASLRVRMLCHQQVLTEFVYVMDKIYGIRPHSIRDIVNDFIMMPGVEIVHELDVRQLLTLWPVVVPDFGDAVLAALGKQRKGAAIASFDAKFMKNAAKLGIRRYPL